MLIFFIDGVQMSLLERVEETYLGVFRFVLIVLATMLLIAVLVGGVVSVSNLRDQPDKPVPVSEVKADDVISDVVALDLEPRAQAKAVQHAEDEAGALIDPNLSYYERTADAIVRFVERFSSSSQKFNREGIITLVKGKAERYKTLPEVQLAYIQGLTETMERGLNSPLVLKRLAKLMGNPNEESNGRINLQSLRADAIDHQTADVLNRVINELMATYSERFAAMEAESDAMRTKNVAEVTARKSSAIYMLYLVGGGFIVFLVMILILVVVRIERNLRSTDDILYSPTML